MTVQFVGGRGGTSIRVGIQLVYGIGHRAETGGARVQCAAHRVSGGAQGSGHVGDFLFGAGKILAALFGGRGILSD